MSRRRRVSSTEPALIFFTGWSTTTWLTIIKAGVGQIGTILLVQYYVWLSPHSLWIKAALNKFPPWFPASEGCCWRGSSLISHGPQCTCSSCWPAESVSQIMIRSDLGSRWDPCPASPCLSINSPQLFFWLLQNFSLQVLDGCLHGDVSWVTSIAVGMSCNDNNFIH